MKCFAGVKCTGKTQEKNYKLQITKPNQRPENNWWAETNLSFFLSLILFLSHFSSVHKQKK